MPFLFLNFLKLKSSFKYYQSRVSQNILLSFGICIISGFIYFYTFKYFGYSSIPQEYYINRDDGVITYSHAVNLIDYGFVGVSPSGERLEGYSTPLQFFFYLIAYGIFNINFEEFNVLQTVCCTFLLGFIFIKFFKENYLFGLLFSFASAFLLTYGTRFLQWHASGMENALSEVFIIATVYVLFRALKEKGLRWADAIIITLASFARVEFIYYVLPLVFTFLIFSNKEILNGKTQRILFLALGLIISIFILRYFYFGSISPNTSVAQGLSIKNNIQKIIQGNLKYLEISESIANNLIRYNLGLYVLLGILIFYFSKRELEIKFVLCCTAIIFTLVYLHAFIFQATRLDAIRYGSQLAPIAILSIFFPLSQIKNTNKKFFFFVLPISLIFLALSTFSSRINMVYLCCDVKQFEPARNSFLKVANENNIYRPLIANPDLGLISYYKNFNIIDIVGLGSPVIAKLLNTPQLLTEYFYELMLPDFFETHDYWSCGKLYLFKDNRFNEKFSPIQYQPNYCPGTFDGFFIKKDILINSESDERILHNKFKKVLSESNPQEQIITIINKEVIKSESSTNLFSSSYIIRTIYKFLPEIKQFEGLREALIKIFEPLPIYNFAYFQLYSDKIPNWSEGVVKFVAQSYLYNNFKNSVPFKIAQKNENLFAFLPEKYLIESTHRIYYNSGLLIFYSPKEIKVDPRGRYIVKLFPEDLNNLSVEDKINGFQRLEAAGNVSINGEGISLLNIPVYKTNKIIVEHYSEETKIWETNMEFNLLK